MSLADTIYEVIKPFPDDMAKEVLDFALYLNQREDTQEWRNLQAAQMNSFTDWNNEDDEVWNHVPEV
ncbi:hypothetical protein JX580_09470 [Thiomicrospira microaerophila]|uniref:hypothetical protein n=1 Tax=Thiomicrospira microaerophila TaxID=406020 RepID=UPI00200C0810|nr:hypothetical protein [Thiomicrospira microaerophila]UQB41887.1 hypothetical protein JX580_09470 [Thiomicrospira microaerophila]